MATVQNMLPGPSNDGEGRMLPVLRQSGSIVKQILADVDALDQKLTSIVSKMRQFTNAGQTFFSQGVPYRSGLDNPALGAGTAHNGMPMGTFSYGPGWAGGGTGPGGGSGPFTPTGPPSSGGGGGGFGTYVGGTLAGVVRASLNQAVAGMPQMYQNDVLYNRLAILNGGGHGAQMAMMNNLGNAFAGGYYSTKDLNAGVQSLYNAGYNALTPGLASGLGQMGQFNAQSLASNVGTLNTMSTANPMAILRLRQMGVQLFDPRTGQLNSPDKWMAALQRATGANYTNSKQISTDFSAWGPMRKVLQSMGLSDDQISNNIEPLFMHQVAGGQVKDTAVNGAQQRALAQTQAESLQYHGLREGMDAANQAARRAAEGLTKAEQASKDFARFLGFTKGFSGALSTHGADGGTSIIGNVANEALRFMGEKYLFGKAGGLLGRVGRGALGKIRGVGGDVGSVGSDIGGVGGDIGGAASLGAGEIAGGAAALGGIGYAGYRGVRHGVDNITNWVKHGFGGLGFGAAGGTNDTGMGTVHQGGSGMMSGTVNTQALLSYATKYIGTPYSWGGGSISGPGKGIGRGSSTVGFDCSSFVQFVFAHFGVMLPRTTYDQVKCGQAVSPDQAQPGDLLFFGPEPHHVGIYLGGGKMINAPHTGADVRIDSVDPRSASAVRRVTRATGGAVNLQGGPQNAANNSGMSAIQAANAAVASMLGTSAFDVSQALGGGVTTSGVGTGPSSTKIPPQPGGGGTYNIKQLAALAQQAGFSGSGLIDAVAVALAESGGDPHSRNVNSDSFHSVDQGLWQINNHWHSEVTNPFDPLTNAKAAFRISNGGKSWNQWSSWSVNHTAQANISKVAAALNSYSKGAWKTKREVAQIHDDEMILPKQIADAVRGALSGYGGGGGGGSCSVVLKVYPQSADHAAAVKLVTMVKEMLDHDNHLDAIGGN